MLSVGAGVLELEAIEDALKQRASLDATEIKDVWLIDPLMDEIDDFYTDVDKGPPEKVSNAGQVRHQYNTALTTYYGVDISYFSGAQAYELATQQLSIHLATDKPVVPAVVGALNLSFGLLGARPDGSLVGFQAHEDALNFIRNLADLRVDELHVVAAWVDVSNHPQNILQKASEFVSEREESLERARRLFAALR